MKMLTSKVLALVFFGWLAVFWLGYLTGKRVPDVLGNRPLATYPHNLTFASPRWCQQSAAWAIERSPFRVAAISLRNRVSYEAACKLQPLPVCPGNGDVSIGRDGWLFLLEDVPENRSKRDMEIIAEQAISLGRTVAKSGRRFVLFPIPDKTSVYPDYIGTLHRWADRYSRRNELPGRLKAAFDDAPDLKGCYLPLWDVYQAHRKSSQELLYLEHDTHWNAMGRLLAVRHLIEGLQPGLWEPGAVHEDGQSPHHGELMASQLLLPDVTFKHDIAILRDGPAPESISSVRVTGFAYQPIERYRCANSRVIKGRTLMISDSFVLGAMPEIATWFEDITFAHFSYTGSSELPVLIRNCDTLIFSSVERFLRWRLNVWNTNRKGYIDSALTPAN